ncbi:MAG TPA: tRNA (adenosine(37)-N6)-dimethylallyltransferase MiaA [Rhodocyclaceae bacterium]|nr:tRNA (adenosine(37)-N6)-dimethylallyltransferase MiaA [Rhodocyclaceae bacterium]
MASLPPVIFLLGPTASGKTALAFELVDRFPLEIISIDSAQVFIDMNIGTAKPDTATLARYPHHLIDLITPEARYSAAQFCTDALRVMHDITARGKVPLIVGGTMLYYKALTEGLADLPQADPELRAQIDGEAATHGWPYLHAELAKLDPETAARLAPNDAQRIQRALEVVRLTGEPMGAIYARQMRQPFPYRTLPLALLPSDRAWLHDRIARRFDEMLAQGLVGETENLRLKYQLHADLPSIRSVGYRQVWDMLEGQIPSRELRDRGIFATRQFAKRQITWLNGLPDLNRFDSLASGTTKNLFTNVHDFLDNAS